MRIKFFSNYASSEELLKRFKENYPITDDLLTFTTGEDYQASVIFNNEIHSDPKINNSIKIYVLQEPTWSSAYIYDDIYRDTKMGYNLGHFLVRKNLNYIESPSFMWFHDHIHYSYFEDSEYIRKKKKLSMIVSNLNLSVANYGKRIDLLNKILASDLDIDIYGKDLKTNDPRYKGCIEYKYEGLLPYEFSIAIENSNEKNYLTEKYIDCVLCNTTPIYNGAPNVDEIYDKRGHAWINLDSSTIIDDIKEIITKKYEPVINKEIYFSKYNLYTKLKEILL